MPHRSSAAELVEAQQRMLAHLRRDEMELKALIERQKRHAEIARQVHTPWKEIAAAVGVPVTTAKNRFAGYAWIGPAKKRQRSETVAGS